MNAGSGSVGGVPASSRVSMAGSELVTIVVGVLLVLVVEPAVPEPSPPPHAVTAVTPARQQPSTATTRRVNGCGRPEPRVRGCS
ncbi:hypothetical protein ABZ177_29515 [Streptomyces sp. NPDC006284]|uniref:hypothetical protein n=1 Tax=unclassified Streptomyces TaxID=2593676 RepID=UPI0033AF63E5